VKGAAGDGAETEEVKGHTSRKSMREKCITQRELTGGKGRKTDSQEGNIQDNEQKEKGRNKERTEANRGREKQARKVNDSSVSCFLSLSLSEREGN